MYSSLVGSAGGRILSKREACAELQPENTVAYLGVSLDDQLKWKNTSRSAGANVLWVWLKDLLTATLGREKKTVH